MILPPWDILWLCLYWAFYILACMGAAILVFAVVIGLWRGFQQARRSRK